MSGFGRLLICFQAEFHNGSVMAYAIPIAGGEHLCIREAWRPARTVFQSCSGAGSSGVFLSSRRNICEVVSPLIMTAFSPRGSFVFVTRVAKGRRLGVLVQFSRVWGGFQLWDF